VQTRVGNPQSASGLVVRGVARLSTGGQRVTLSFLGATPLQVRPGQFIDVENAAGEHERVPVVAVEGRGVDVEVIELEAAALVRARGPFDSPR
jgi:hypothetical protein